MIVRRRPTLALAALAAWAFGPLGGCAGKAPAPNARPASVPRGVPGTPSASPQASPRAIPIDVSAVRVGKRSFVLTKSKANRKLYVLRADSEHGRYFGTDTGVSTFVNPHVVFYGRDGKQLIADAPTGTAVEKEKTVRLSGGVRAHSQDGLKLRCETLLYDDETDLAHGLGNVTVTSPQGEELQGDTLTWNLRDGTIDVAGAH